MPDTIFDLIIRKEIPSWIIWEDNTHLAFLTPFANTPGQTVVIPKVNVGDYIFDIDDPAYIELMKATKIVGKLLERALGVQRVAMVFEGTGVAHVHAKLYPLHGKLAGKTNVWSAHQEFYPEYIGYLSTVEGPKMSDNELTEIQKKIVESINI